MNLPAGTVKILRTDILAGTQTQLFHTAFYTGVYQIVSTKPEKKSDTGWKKNTGWQKKNKRNRNELINGKGKYHVTHNTAVANTVPKVTNHSSSSSRPSLHPSASLWLGLDCNENVCLCFFVNSMHYL